MNDGIVADEHIVSNMNRHIMHDMNGCVFLDVRVLTDDNGLKIAAHNGAEPNARSRTNRHIANDDRRRCNEYRWVYLGCLAAVRQNDLLHQYALLIGAAFFRTAFYYTTPHPLPTRIFSAP